MTIIVIFYFLFSRRCVFVNTDKHIILNCTYQNNFEDIISDKNIGWRIREKNEFKDVAIFSRPGGYPPYVAPYIEDLNKNRIELAQHHHLKRINIFKQNCVQF